MNDPVALFEALAPPGLVALGAVVVVLLDAITQGARTRAPGSRLARIRQSLLSLSSGAFIFFAFAVAGFNLVFSEGTAATPDAMLKTGPGSHFSMALLCAVALMTLWFAASGPRKSGVQRSEFHALLLFSLAGCLVAVCAGNLVTLVLAIELASLPAIALVALERDRERSVEASTRLWLVVGFAGAITLYGVAMLYGAAGGFSYSGVAAAGASSGSEATLFAVGIALVLAGLLTRLGIAPFHHWLPNVGDGASPIAAAWATCAVVGAVSFATLHLVQESHAMQLAGLREMLALFAMFSMAVGSVLALLQSSVKRVLAYGGVVHAGLFLGVLSLGEVENNASAAAAFLEVSTFVVMQLGAFGVLSVLTRERSGGVQLGEFAGLAERAPILAAAFAVLLLGLAGLPGTVGFISRFQLMQVMIANENVGLALMVGAATVVLFAAYLRIAIAMYMLRGPESETPPTPLPATVALLACAVSTLVFGILPAGGVIPFDLLEITRLAAMP